MQARINSLKYCPTDYAVKVLKNARILASKETPQEMFKRVINTLFEVEKEFNMPPKDTATAKYTFAKFLADKAFTPGTPTLNNAGRPEYANSALSSCAIIPVNLMKKEESIKKIKAYYKQNMGSGFDFTPYKDPVGLLIWLNDLSAKETATGNYDRYIGNMGNLHVSHPRIRSFIKAKRLRKMPHFNLSVDVDDKFMRAAIEGKKYTLKNGRKINAALLLKEIAKSTWINGDPSIINLERMNRHNPLLKSLPYTTTPPCSEMGMATGETCQFGYINIAYFVKQKGIDYSLLAKATRSLTRALDNAAQISAKHYPDKLSSEIVKTKRKIGIGISGIADTLLYYDIPYDSQKARDLVKDIANFVNYISKLESVDLAEKRGSCDAMNDTSNLYFNGYLEGRYAQDTKTVTAKKWFELAKKIKKTKLLRNIQTTALPPAARVSILMNCSQGIEPIFGVPKSENLLLPSVKNFVKKHAKRKYKQIIEQALKEGTFQNVDFPHKECLKTAKEISYMDHLLMVAALVGKEGVIDESASKTVNLPNNATKDEIFNIFLLAHKMGLKNISVYRDGSIQNQPYNL